MSPPLSLLTLDGNPNKMHPVDDIESFLANLRPIMPLLDLLPNVVFFVKNTQAEYVLVNRTLQNRLGVKNEDHLIKKTAEELFVGKQGYEYLLQDLDVLAGNPIVDKLELHTYASGRLGWCITHKIPIYHHSLGVVAMVGVSIDIDKDNGQRLKNHEKLASLLEYIHANIEQKITVSSMAEQAGLSISALERSLKSLLGLSPLQILQKIRLERAIELLKDSQEPIVSIAILCGYGDHSAFSRQFKQLTGLSPTEFRKLQQIKADMKA